jgi:hypothetical protein
MKTLAISIANGLGKSWWWWVHFVDGGNGKVALMGLHTLLDFDIH